MIVEPSDLRITSEVSLNVGPGRKSKILKKFRINVAINLPIPFREWYNSYVKAVKGTSSEMGTIATVEKLDWDGLLSTVVEFGPLGIF